MKVLDKIDMYLNEIVNNLTDHIPSKYMSKTILKAATRKKMNTQIQKVLKQTYFKDIPLDDLFDILKKNGLVAIQEDNTEWSGFLLGGVKKTQMVNFNLGWKDQFEKVHGNKVYMAVPNAVLLMTYYKMPSGKYEVIGYVS